MIEAAVVHIEKLTNSSRVYFFMHRKESGVLVTQFATQVKEPLNRDGEVLGGRGNRQPGKRV
jgi:hypothetical protein